MNKKFFFRRESAFIFFLIFAFLVMEVNSPLFAQTPAPRPEDIAKLRELCSSETWEAIIIGYPPPATSVDPLDYNGLVSILEQIGSNQILLSRHIKSIGVNFDVRSITHSQPPIPASASVSASSSLIVPRPFSKEELKEILIDMLRVRQLRESINHKEEEIFWPAVVKSNSMSREQINKYLEILNNLAESVAIQDAVAERSKLFMSPSERQGYKSGEKAGWQLGWAVLAPKYLNQIKDILSANPPRQTRKTGFGVPMGGAETKKSEEKIRFNASLEVVITNMPSDPPGENMASEPIAGTVRGVNLSKYKIVIYAYSVNRWYVQPYDTSPYTDIDSEGKWQTETHGGTEFAALLVRSTFKPPATLIKIPQVGGEVFAVTKRKVEKKSDK